MSKPIPKVRKPRKDSRYTREEMQVISKHKQEYREQTTRELRGNVFKTKILVDVFNLWLKQGKTPITEEDSATRMKVICNLSKVNHLFTVFFRSLLLGYGTTGVHFQLPWTLKPM